MTRVHRSRRVRVPQAQELRKRPSQERSRALVESLVEATARILIRDGYDALSTNRVAVEAGVSVGSLYQYVTNKDTLVRMVAERWAEGAAAEFVRLRAELAGATVDAGVRRIVDVALAMARADVRLHRAMLEQLPRIGVLPIFDALGRRAADLLAEWIAERRDELAVPDPSLTAHVIVTTLDGLTDHALLLRPELLDSPRFARELEALVLGYLRARAPAPGVGPRGRG